MGSYLLVCLWFGESNFLSGFSSSIKILLSNSHLPMQKFLMAKWKENKTGLTFTTNSLLYESRSQISCTYSFKFCNDSVLNSPILRLVRSNVVFPCITQRTPYPAIQYGLHWAICCTLKSSTVELMGGASTRAKGVITKY